MTTTLLQGQDFHNQDAIMTHQPPSPPNAQRRGLHPLLKRLLILLAIPVLAYAAFLAFVLGYAVLVGPIRWN
jgi:hypothetical protein